ncbi:MAG: BamA/TamA family outer membrane protein [Pseudomonadota bacterium]
MEEHRFVVASGSARSPDAAALGSPVGEPAAAAAIVGAETAAVEELKRTGYPYARRLKRRAVADLEAATLEVQTPLASGPSSVFGEVTFEGLEDVRARYLRTSLPWEPGDVVDTRQLRAYQRALLATDLFDTISVRLPEEPPEGEDPAVLPVAVVAEERPFRTASAGLRYSTDNGPSVSGGLEHRNLFGENEILTTEADVGLEEQTIGFGYREPQYLRSGQDLLGSLVLKREEDDAFDSLSATATLGLQRRLSKEWVVGAGVLGEASLITDEGVETTAFLGGLPVFAEYDDTDDLLNPTSGTRFRGEVTPFAGIFDDEFAGFLKLDTTASGYLKLLRDDRYVLAGRGRFATILAEDVDKVPQTRRLYSGGGGSVRGFAQRFVGELDANNDPIGGLSAVELGAEVRAKVYGDIGGVLFVDAGAVSAETFPAFDNGVQVAAGFGFRYYSPVGPIRFDVAFPLNGRDADDVFQFYFSIGQAF